MNEEVDVNALITLYNQKVSQLSNQNILLEAKLQTLMQDFKELKEKYTKGNLIYLTGFTSTTLSINTAVNFAKKSMQEH